MARARVRWGSARWCSFPRDRCPEAVRALSETLLGRRFRVGLAVATVLALASCGSEERNSAQGVGVDEYLDSCFSETEELHRASLSYDSRFELTKSEAKTFTLTLSNQPLGVPGSTSDELRVACTVSARLIAPSSRVEVTPTDWVQQQYVPPRDTTWKWVVAGRAAGQSEAVVEVRPAIRLTNSDGSTRLEDLRTEQFPVTFAVGTTWKQKMTSYWGALTGGATGVATLIGAWFLLRKLFTGRAAEDDTDETDNPKPDR